LQTAKVGVFDVFKTSNICLDTNASKNLIKRLWAIAHSILLFFFCFFFSFTFLAIFAPNLFLNFFIIPSNWLSIALILKHREEAEAGAAEEQPARNISDYPEHINNIIRQLSFLGSPVFFLFLSFCKIDRSC
jgi:hypothetical protein